MAHYQSLEELQRKMISMSTDVTDTDFEDYETYMDIAKSDFSVESPSVNEDSRKRESHVCVNFKDKNTSSQESVVDPFNLFFTNFHTHYVPDESPNVDTVSSKSDTSAESFSAIERLG